MPDFSHPGPGESLVFNIDHGLTLLSIINLSLALFWILGIISLFAFVILTNKITL